MHEAGLLAPLVALAAGPAQPSAGGAASTGTCEAGGDAGGGACGREAREAVGAACQLLAAVDESLDAEAVGQILRHLEGQFDGGAARPISCEVGARCIATLWALAQHAAHRRALAAGPRWAALLERGAAPALARLKRAPRLPSPGAAAMHAGGPSCSIVGPPASAAVPRLQLGDLASAAGTCDGAGTSAGCCSGDGSRGNHPTGDAWGAALAAATLAVRAAWLLLREAAAQRAAAGAGATAAGVDAVYKGSPSGWWGVQLPPAGARGPGLVGVVADTSNCEDVAGAAALGLLLKVAALPALSGSAGAAAKQAAAGVLHLRAEALRACWSLAAADAVGRGGRGGGGFPPCMGVPADR
jgi:hypothetical protein